MFIHYSRCDTIGLYYHKDHLGSSTVITDASAGQVEYSDYLPFGGKREHTGTSVTNYKYTDQELDPSTGLYNYDARLYDPVVGRFVTADSIIPNWYNPQLLNRYAYVKNNPLIYVYPSGHWPDSGWDSSGDSISKNPTSDNYGGHLPGGEAERAENASIREIGEKAAEPILKTKANIEKAVLGYYAGSKVKALWRWTSRLFEKASKNEKPGSYTPDRTLPTDKHGVPTPDVDVPHTQLGRSKPKYGSEPQAREWDYGSNGKLQPKHDIDFTDHGYPDAHPDVPHKHKLTPNNPKLAPKGGYQRGSGGPL